MVVVKKEHIARGIIIIITSIFCVSFFFARSLARLLILSLKKMIAKFFISKKVYDILALFYPTSAAQAQMQSQSHLHLYLILSALVLCSKSIKISIF